MIFSFEWGFEIFIEIVGYILSIFFLLPNSNVAGNLLDFFQGKGNNLVI